MNFLFVSWACGPCFHDGDGFLGSTHFFTFVDIWFLIPPHHWLRWTVVGNTDVDVALPTVGSDAKVCEWLCDIHIIEIHVDIPVIVGIPVHHLIGDGDALLQFRHVVQGGWRVCNVSVQFNVQVLNVGVKNHREPHHAFSRPRPFVVEEAPLAVGNRIVVPFVWDFV